MCVIYLILFYLWVLELILGFPGCSAGKETAGNEGDSSSTPGWGRSPEEGIAYPLRYFWATPRSLLPLERNIMSWTKA